MEMALFMVGAVAFLVGGATLGALGWLWGSTRARARVESALRVAETQAGAAGARADELANQARQADGRANGLEAALRQVEQQRTAAVTRAEEMARSLDQQRGLLEAAKVQLSDTFAALAAESLRSSHEGFLALASERLGAVRQEGASDLEARQKAIEGVVAPMRASLEKVDLQIRQLEAQRAEAYGTLTAQVGAMAATQERLRAETGNLVNALRAPAVRGRWGEIQLRRVVELAGMLEHCDFDQQASVTTEDGRVRPDLVVRLPNRRNIVVDAKAPLAAYLEALEATSEEERTVKLRQHAAQVRAHVTKLSAKSYWEQFDVAPELVVMFLPAETFYSLALEQMPGLIEDGFAQRVLIATPTTLLGLLRAVNSGWREERLAENAQRISDEGRKLHERIATVLEHFADLGKGLSQSVKHFNAAMVSFDRRVVVSARRLDELDARGKKPLPERPQIDVRPFTVTPPDALPPRAPVALTLALTPSPAPASAAANMTGRTDVG